MAKDSSKTTLTEPSARFGMKALDMGFVSIDQVLETLSEQVMENYLNQRHRLLGDIFLDKGWMTPEQIQAVLDAIARDKEKTPVIQFKY